MTVLIPPDRQAEEPEILARLRRGERVEHYETVRRRKDGSSVAISLTVSPIKDATGRVVGASKIARDISERKRAEERQELLLREMSHRVKNLFAVASGLVRLSARSAQTPSEMAEALQARLSALSRVHGLTRAGLIDPPEAEKDTTLHGLIQVIFAPYLGPESHDRLSVSGCNLTIRSTAITSLALLLHELATNAVKYGAFSNSQGCILITCSVEENVLLLQWKGTWRTAAQRRATACRVRHDARRADGGGSVWR